MIRDTGPRAPIERRAGPREPKARRHPCAAQQCGSDDGGCDAVLLEGLWRWSGEDCVPADVSGCGVVGPDCKRLYEDRDACLLDKGSCALERY